MRNVWNERAALLIGFLVVLSLGMYGCERKQDSSKESPSVEPSASSGPAGEEKGEADEKQEVEPPSPKERLEVLKEQETEKAQKSVTAENAESVAEELEADLEDELAGN